MLLLKVLSIEDLEGMEGVVKIDFAKEKIAAGIDVVSFLSGNKYFSKQRRSKKNGTGRRSKYQQEKN